MCRKHSGCTGKNIVWVGLPRLLRLLTVIDNRMFILSVKTVLHLNSPSLVLVFQVERKRRQQLRRPVERLKLQKKLRLLKRRLPMARQRL